MLAKVHTGIGAVWIDEGVVRARFAKADEILAGRWKVGLADVGDLMRGGVEVSEYNPEAIVNGVVRPDLVDPDSSAALHHQVHGAWPTVEDKVLLAIGFTPAEWAGIDKRRGDLTRAEYVRRAVLDRLSR